MRKYFTPPTHRTGCLVQQPRAAATSPGWYLDRDLNDLEFQQCIDAPDLLPNGSVRAVDSGPLTIGVDYQYREDARYFRC